jgi:hypothetical protein
MKMTTYNYTRFIKASLLAAMLFVAVSSADGGIIDVTLTNPPLSGSPGSTLQFFGTLSNNASLEEFLNGADSSGDANLKIDTSPFLLDPTAAAPISLAANGQPGAIATGIHLFDVTIDPAAGPGFYGGQFEVIGGADGGNSSAQDILDSVTFSVQAPGSAASTPEPSSGALLAAGIALLAWRGKSAISGRAKT